MKVKSAILLSGGNGTRLAPATHHTNKHLLVVNKKFIIDYPLITLSNIGVTNLTVVLGGPHFSQVVSHIKGGEQYGMNVNYVYQGTPSGIAQAINVCKDFVHDEQFVVILGDNIFENNIKFIDSDKSAQIVLNKHKELNRFGVASYSGNKLMSIVEKPKTLNTNYDNYAITGCYLFNQDYFRYFERIVPSDRGEYEITDIIKMYHQDNNLDRTFTNGLWSDAGTHESINFLNNYFANN